MNVSKIAVLTDSGCDLSPELIQKWNIRILPLMVCYPDGTQYKDGVDITPDEVYRQLPHNVPSTSLPPMQDTIDLLNALKEEGYTDILAVMISSGLSGTSNMVRLAAEEVTDIQVHVFDTRTLSGGEGFLAIHAAELIQKGLSAQEILPALEKERSNISVFYSIPTLEYLKKGGRIGGVSALVGSLLDIKPIIAVNEEGKYFPMAVSRGMKKAVSKMKQKVEEVLETSQLKLAILHGAAPEEAQKLAEFFKQHKNVLDLYIGQISPALGVHTGPGLIGFAFHVQ